MGTSQGQNFIKFLSKLSSGNSSNPPPKFQSAGGWILCSFVPKFAKFQSKLPSYFKTQSQFSRGARRTALRKPGSIEKPVEQLTQEQVAQFPQGFKMDKIKYIVKPVVFTAFVGVGSSVACTIWEYENYRKLRLSERYSISDLLNRALGKGEERQQQQPLSVSRPGDLVGAVKSWWANLKPGEKIFWPIFGANALVWLAWRVPAFAPWMVSNFSSSPVGRKLCLPMLLSTFSHYSFLHLCANMFVLHSFTPALTEKDHYTNKAILGKEHFLAFYLTAGTVSSLGSHLHKLVVRNATPSLGASGAILGVLGMVCTLKPETQLGLIFLPGYHFSADTALKCILAIDAAGVFLGWRFMDHAAHLGGCLFGIACARYGRDAYWNFRDYVAKQWHAYRIKSS